MEKHNGIAKNGEASQKAFILSNLMNEAKRMKAEGNTYYTSNNYQASESAYSQGLKVVCNLAEHCKKLKDSNELSESFLNDVTTLKITLSSNQALVLLKLGRNEEAEKVCDDPLKSIQRDRYMEYKLQYRRALAREAMGKHKEAEIDLENCLSNLQQIGKGNSLQDQKQKEIRDTTNVLKRVREKRQNLMKQENNNNDLQVIERCDISDTPKNNEYPSRIIVDDAGSNSVSSQTGDEFTIKRNHDDSKIEHIEYPTSNSISSEIAMNHNSTMTMTKVSNERISAKTNTKTILHCREKQLNETKGILKARHHIICPSIETQREVIMRLLSQSPQLGEAFFLINYEWWRIWCRHVNFFMDYEYHMYGSASTTEIENEHEIAMLDRRRDEILQLLPIGACIPEQSYENKKRKAKRSLSTVSNDSSINMESIDSSSSEDEEDSDIDSCSDRMKYGASPSVINNSQLILQLSKESKSTNKDDSYASAIFHYEWNYKVRQESTCSHICAPYLRPRLVHGHHFEILPREVYAALRSWYGESTSSIHQRTFLCGDKIRLNLYPGLQSNESSISFGPSLSNSNNVKYCGACKASNARRRCSRCASMYYCGLSCQASHWYYHESQCRNEARRIKQQNIVKETSLSMPPEQDTQWGKVGLSNLGNTCFMNAALQCLSHATPLTRHFLTNRYKDDINLSNPLGTGGKLANAYDKTMKDMWMSRDKGSISPTALKRAISMFAPRFAGVSQHDSQEFLAFLLDGLHEDLNRIQNPPYVEKPDVMHGQKMSVAGEECWDAHCLRNRSLVMDTFYGQFKSKCICPKCEKVSVSFDVFNHVSLEIPQRRIEMNRTIPVLLFSSNSSSSPPIRYAVSVPKNGCIGHLKASLSQMIGLHTERLALCDVYDHTIYEIFDDNKAIMSLGKDDLIVAYEIDPYSKTTIHVISTHLIIRNLPNIDNQENRTTQKISTGYPLMTSFGTEVSCREVWNHVHKRMSYILPEGSNRTESLNFRIRLVDSNGNPQAVFNKMLFESEQSQHMEQFSSLLPVCDEMFCKYLGNDCIESFLFISIEWDFQRPLNTNFVEKTFHNFTDHTSIIQAIKQQKSTNNDVITLENCLETFTDPERLDENNKWYCSSCKEHVRAEKTLEIWRLPNVLIIHLKRFEFRHSLRREKLETFIDCPLEGLDMSKYCAPSSNDGIDLGQREFVINGVPADYDLFAVVNHYGRMGFGHYTACARRWNEKQMCKDWALFDDSTVKKNMSKEQVVTPAAYVLFYRRRIFT